MRHRLSSVAVAATTLLLAAMPAAADGRLGTPQSLLGAQGRATCGPDSGGDAAIAADGTTLGFARCDTTQIWFFSATPGSAPVREPSPYVGAVLSVAWDGVDATYVLFLQDNRLSIGKRIASSVGDLRGSGLESELPTWRPETSPHRRPPTVPRPCLIPGYFGAVWNEPRIQLARS